MAQVFLLPIFLSCIFPATIFRIPFSRLRFVLQRAWRWIGLGFLVGAAGFASGREEAFVRYALSTASQHSRVAVVAVLLLVVRNIVDCAARAHRRVGTGCGVGGVHRRTLLDSEFRTLNSLSVQRGYQP